MPTITGTAGADTLAGTPADETITGLGGNDTLAGGGGADTFLDTAAGHNGDTITDLSLGDHIVITDMAYANFTLSYSGGVLSYNDGSLTTNDTISLTALPAGRIVVNEYASGGVDLRFEGTALNDFNGDGSSDVLWRNDTGGLSNWLSNANGGFTVDDSVAFKQVTTDWKVAGTGDFNGDGKIDVLWRNDTGALSDWLSSANGAMTPNDGNALRQVSNDWHVASTGDFNGDGRDDILWRNDNGAMSDWLGTGTGGFTTNDTNAFSSVPKSWHIAGTGDFNGDGRDDILWRNDSGALSDWLANPNGGFTANDAAAFTQVDNIWHITGTGDFNGDGRADILWRNDSGALSDWLGNANGGFTPNDANAFTSVPTSWHVVGTGDYNNDGGDDILWRNDDGSFSDWLSTATGGFEANDANAFVHVPTVWHTQPPELIV